MTSDTSVRLTGLVLPALVTAAQFGPFFRWEPWSPGAGWLPWTALADADVAAERVGTARETLIAMFGLPPGAVPARVVASVTFLGYASRVVSPLLAAAATAGTLPAPGPSDLWWRPEPGGPLPIAYAGTEAQPSTHPDPAAVAEALAEVAVTGLLMPLLATFRECFALSPKVLLGNISSALAGAAGMIADQARLTEPASATATAGTATAGTADPATRAAQVVEAMLGMAPLAGTGTLVRPAPPSPRSFLVRNNCCLYYRIPGGGTCGDCVLTSAGERRRGWEAQLAR